MDQAVLKICAVKADRHLWGEITIAVAKGCRLVIVVGGVLTAVVWLTSPLLSITVFGDADLLLPIRIMSLSIVPFSLLNVMSEALRGLKKITQSSLLQTVCVPLCSCLLFAVASLVERTVAGAVFAYLAGTIITALFGFRLWRRAIPSMARSEPNRPILLRELLSLSIPMGWATTMVLVMGMADSIILGVFGTSEELGVYAAALRLSMVATLALLAVNSIAAPKFAELYRSRALHDLEKLAQRANAIMLLIASPLLLLYFTFPYHIMGIFGTEFRRGGAMLVVLAIGQMVTIMMGSVGYLLLMTQYENVMKWINFAAALANVSLSLALVPFWGGLGAACANTSSLCLLNLIAVISVWKRLRLSTIPFLTRTHPN
jgi:O-antigen/teichoic acid export membrane protein